MLNRDISKPLYSQIHSILVERIHSGEYGINSMIPSESALCNEFGVSRSTLRGVITQLVQVGLLYRVQGKGTFVAEPKITADTTVYVGIREQLEAQGYEVRTEVIDLIEIKAGKTIANKMGIHETDSVYKLVRVRYVKDSPLSLHISYIPKKFCSDLETQDLKNEQLCAILATEYKQVRKNVVETLESVVANADESAILQVKKGDPLLLLRDSIYNASGEMFEYSSVAFRGDRIQIQMQYKC